MEQGGYYSLSRRIPAEIFQDSISNFCKIYAAKENILQLIAIKQVVIFMQNSFSFASVYGLPLWHE